MGGDTRGIQTRRFRILKTVLRRWAIGLTGTSRPLVMVRHEVLLTLLSCVRAVAVPAIGPVRFYRPTHWLKMHTVSAQGLSMSPSVRLPPSTIFLWSRPAKGKRDRVEHPIQQVIRIVCVSSGAKGAHALHGRLLGLVVLSRPEGIVEANGKKDLLEGNQERRYPNREIFARYFVGSF